MEDCEGGKCAGTGVQQGLEDGSLGSGEVDELGKLVRNDENSSHPFRDR